MLCPSSLRLAWADQLAEWLPPELLERTPREPDLNGKAGIKQAKARRAARKKAGTDFANIVVIRTGAVMPRSLSLTQGAHRSQFRDGECNAFQTSVRNSDLIMDPKIQAEHGSLGL